MGKLLVYFQHCYQHRRNGSIGIGSGIDMERKERRMQALRCRLGEYPSLQNALSTERISSLHRHITSSNLANSVSPKPLFRPRSQTLTSGRLRIRPWSWCRRRFQIRHLVALLCHLRASRPFPSSQDSRGAEYLRSMSLSSVFSRRRT